MSACLEAYRYSIELQDSGMVRIAATDNQPRAVLALQQLITATDKSAIIKGDIIKMALGGVDSVDISTLIENR